MKKGYQIRLTEEEFNQVIAESVVRVLNEGGVSGVWNAAKNIGGMGWNAAKGAWYGGKVNGQTLNDLKTTISEPIGAITAANKSFNQSVRSKNASGAVTSLNDMASGASSLQQAATNASKQANYMLKRGAASNNFQKNLADFSQQVGWNYRNGKASGQGVQNANNGTVGNGANPQMVGSNATVKQTNQSNGNANNNGWVKDANGNYYNKAEDKTLTPYQYHEMVREKEQNDPNYRFASRQYNNRRNGWKLFYRPESRINSKPPIHLSQMRLNSIISESIDDVLKSERQ